jgi:hypothetical protein
VLIRVWIEDRQPLAGTAAREGSEPLRFDGWLELLRVVSELVAAAPAGGGDRDPAKRAGAGKSGGHVTRLRPGSPAHEQPAPGGSAARPTTAT